MPLLIPPELIIEKNKLYPGNVGLIAGVALPAELPAEMISEMEAAPAGSAFVELLEIRLQSGETIRLVNCNRDVIWGGHTWTRFRFEPGDISDGDDSDSQSVTIRVSNIAYLDESGTSQTVQSKIESLANLMIGDTVVYRMVHGGFPDKDPAITGYFEIMEVDADDEWASFDMGVENFYINAFPGGTFRRNVCGYKPHQTSLCPYVASGSCNRSFSVCITLGQSSVFNGQPGIPGGVWIV